MGLGVNYGNSCPFSKTYPEYFRNTKTLKFKAC
jgi:hypothetical protein